MKRKFMLVPMFISFMLSGTLFSFADIVKTPVHYRQGDTNLEGLLVYDNSVQTPRPGVVIFPEWWGLTDYPKHRAEQLAQLGYVAFAADMYGDDKTTDNPTEAEQLMKGVEGNIDLLRARARPRWTHSPKTPTSIPKRSPQ